MEKRSTSELSPLSPTRWPPEAFAWQRSLAALALVVVAFGAGSVLAGLTAGELGTTRSDVVAQHLNWGILVAQLVTYVFLVPTLLIVLPWAARRSLT